MGACQVCGKKYHFASFNHEDFSLTDTSHTINFGEWDDKKHRLLAIEMLTKAALARHTDDSIIVAMEYGVKGYRNMANKELAAELCDNGLEQQFNAAK